MKHKGACFEYAEERDRDLLRAFKELIKTYDQVTIGGFYKQLVNMPSARFWVSEERAAIVIAKMLRGENLKARETFREMYTEIYKRVVKLRKQRPDEPLRKLVAEVVKQPAPKFYLTPDSATRMIARIKKAEYEKRLARMPWLKQK